MKKHKALMFLAAGLVVLVVVVASAFRISQVNSIQYGEAPGGSRETEDGSVLRHLYRIGEQIDLSGYEADKKKAPQGYMVTYDSHQIVEADDIQSEFPDWAPYYSSATEKYDPEKYLKVRMTVTNNSEEEASPLWFRLESTSWSTIVNPQLTALMNGASGMSGAQKETGEESAAHGSLTVPPHESRTFTVVYSLWEPTFSEQQWQNVYDLPYSLVLLDYPDKLIVNLTEG
ncbi:MAG: hypothetical protein LBG81_09060 [Coriobacteriaceae bacterium]|jgi:hypothetical protein|nr:hypothetical protein [Coriobacteriaceae bacterium]